jgi:superfamily II DNA or RNA helicase
MSYISKLVNQISKSGNTLVLVDRIESGKFLQSYLNNLGEDVAFISGEVKLKDRKNEYDEIKTADNKIIIATYGVAAIGINIPRIFNMILLEPGKSFVRVIQSIGRGIRKADDKDHVEIWDITANTKYAKKHLTDRKKFYSDAKYPFSIEKITYT